MGLGLLEPSLAPDDAQWDTIARRREGDGWVFCVITTGVFCRPSCPARRPHRDNVRVLVDPAAARRAGFRPCRRCNPEDPESSVRMVERATSLLRPQGGSGLTLSEMAKKLGTTSSRLHHAFGRTLGVSPAEFQRALRREAVQQRLRAGETVRAASNGVGHRSTSRLHGDRNDLGMSPSSYRSGGPFERIRFLVAPCPLGRVLVAATDRGVCAVRLGDEAAELETELRSEFPQAELEADTGSLRRALDEILARMDGRPPSDSVPLDLRSTAFRQRVWAALMKVPHGSTTTYSALAAAVGAPSAVRAVASACASNPVAVLVPCHRVIAKGGGLAGYRWGLERKRALLQREAQPGRRPS